MNNDKYKKWLSVRGLSQLAEYAYLGLNRGQIARLIGVADSTLEEWQRKFSPIAMALSADEEFRAKLVEAALIKRAVGYSYYEITEQLNKEGEFTITKEVEKEAAGNISAQMFWLKNRCGFVGGQEEAEEGGIVMLPDTVDSEIEGD